MGPPGLSKGVLKFRVSQVSVKVTIAVRELSLSVTRPWQVPMRHPVWAW
jgi:hypothetical protein